jgi:hypothetical protein
MSLRYGADAPRGREWRCPAPPRKTLPTAWQGRSRQRALPASLATRPGPPAFYPLSTRCSPRGVQKKLRFFRQPERREDQTDADRFIQTSRR